MKQNMLPPKAPAPRPVPRMPKRKSASIIIIIITIIIDIITARRCKLSRGQYISC